MIVLQRILNIGISGDMNSLEKLARQIFNFDNLMGVFLPFCTIILYSLNGVLTLNLLLWHLLIMAYFALNLVAIKMGYYKTSVFVTIGVIYLLLCAVALLFLNLFNALFFIPLSFNALIYFPEQKRLSLGIFAIYIITAMGLFLVELNYFSFNDIDPFKQLQIKAAIGFFSYLFFYKIVSFLLMYWRTLSRKDASEEGIRNFLKFTTEGIYNITFEQPIPVSLPIEEQYQLFKETGRFIQCNDAFADLYNYPSSQALNGLSVKQFREGIPDTGMAVAYSDFAQAGYVLLDQASQEISEDGKYTHLLNNVIGILEGGYLKGIWGAQRNITELTATKETIAMRDQVTEKLMSSFPIVYYRFDQELTIQLSVGGGLKKLGLQNNQVVGGSIKERYRTFPEIIEAHEKVLMGGEASFLTRVPRGEGELFFDTRITFDKDKGEGIGLAFETTERKIAENALLKTENRYKNLFRNSFDAILVFNVVKGVFIDCNEHARRLFKTSPYQDIETLTPIDLVPNYQPDGRPSALHIKEHIAALIAGETLQFEFSHKRVNGEIFETETTLMPNTFDNSEILVMIKNVSDRKKAEKALIASERQLREAQKVALLGSWEYDYATEGLTWSSQLYELFKIDKNLSVNFDPCLLNILSEEFHEDLLKIKNLPEKKNFNFFYKKEVPESGIRWFQMRGEKSFDAENKPAKISGIVQDITNKKNQEEIIRTALKALNEKNEDLKKYIDSNMQLENFAYMASHDLKAPIRTIVSFTQLLKRSLKDRLQENEAEYLYYISSGANSMKNLIEDLLTYSRVNTKNHQLEDVALPAVIEQIKTALSTDLEASMATIKVNNIPDLIQADVTMMRQLFQNLLENAIKFRKENLPPNIEIGCLVSDEYWNFHVKDNGIGISPEFQEKIFLLFRKLHSSSKYEGTGIGLALCKKIVEQHGGKIWVDEEYTGGTCFQFTLRRRLLEELV